MHQPFRLHNSQYIQKTINRYLNYIIITDVFISDMCDYDFYKYINYCYHYWVERDIYIIIIFNKDLDTQTYRNIKLKGFRTTLF
jgi:hypothetical protein